MSYPAILLPQPTYRLLTPADISAGWLLRRTAHPVRTTTMPDGRVILVDPTQMCDIPAHFGMKFSVNLAGQFESQHAGWGLVPGNPEASARIREHWQPPSPVTPPTAAEMHYIATSGVLGLQIEAIQGRWFSASGFGDWQAEVMHAPNCWNYWHYEVGFHNQDGQWLHEYKQHTPRILSNRHWELACDGLLHSFQEAGLAKPLSYIGTPLPWPTALFDTAVSLPDNEVVD